MKSVSELVIPQAPRPVSYQVPSNEYFSEESIINLFIVLTLSGVGCGGSCGLGGGLLSGMLF